MFPGYVCIFRSLFLFRFDTGMSCKKKKELCHFVIPCPPLNTFVPKHPSSLHYLLSLVPFSRLDNTWARL